MNFTLIKYCHQLLICYLLIISINHADVQAQVSGPGRPYPCSYAGSPKIPVYELEVNESQKLSRQPGESGNMLKPAISGAFLQVDYTPEKTGIWDTLNNGTKLWRIGLYVQNAVFINLVFKPYNISKGVKIFLYDIHQRVILGSFTDMNNKSSNILATAGIPDDTLIIEMQVPGYIDSYGHIAVANVGCDFKESESNSYLKDGWFGKSGSCNLDINCVSNSLQQLVKRSVVRVIYDGTSRCTGTLVNNTQKDGKYYILTAEHCINDETTANNALFYFGYESPYCDGPDGNSAKSISGATMLATGNTLDFTLLELLEPVPLYYQAYYAGWDRTANAPASGFTIHHPLGDVKKISVENHPLVAGSYGSTYQDNTHWRVRHWETGTTEGGSSGAPFFNPLGRIAGTLTGGMATCNLPYNDFFQMFSHSWNDFPQPEHQLAYWLDPEGSQPGFIDGYDPFEDFWESGDTLSNITREDLIVQESGTLSWGSYSGHNSDFLSQFAERFTTDSDKKMLGMLVNVADNYIASASASITFRVWNGNSLPDKILYEKSLYLADLSAEDMCFVEFDSLVSVRDTFFTGYELHYDMPQDTFSTYMAANRIVDPYNSAYVFDGLQWKSLDEYTDGQVYSSFAVMPVVFDSIPANGQDTDSTDMVIAYPNPATTFISIEMKEHATAGIQVSLFNLQGQLVYEGEFNGNLQVIRLEHLDLSNGIYIIRVKQGNFIANLKIAIIR
jgi:lysyl endopeptidase